MRRANYAYIHWNRLRAAKPFNRAIFQRPERFRLRDRIHVANFIEKQCAARRQFKFSLLLLCRAGECAAFVAEEFRFN